MPMVASLLRIYADMFILLRLAKQKGLVIEVVSSHEPLRTLRFPCRT
jgi:hypothetical protein